MLKCAHLDQQLLQQLLQQFHTVSQDRMTTAFEQEPQCSHCDIFDLTEKHMLNVSAESKLDTTDNMSC